MNVQSGRSGLILLVVAAVLLAGCGGDAGTGDGTLTGTPTPTTDQPEPTEATDEPESTENGEQDVTSTPTATRATDEAATSTPTPTETQPTEETTTPSVTPTPPTTVTATPSGNGDSASFSGEDHVAALREAGSYTVTFHFEGTSDGNDSGVTVLSGTEEIDLETGERYSTVTSESEGESFSFEYYLPPDSDTAYQRVSGQTREVSESQALFFNFSDPGTGDNSEEWPDFREAGSGETTLGSATKYVVDSAEDLPESTREEFDSIESVNFVVWVDDDTGVIAKYDYDITYTDDGEENAVRVEFEITDLGSTTIEKPDWAP